MRSLSQWPGDHAAIRRLREITMHLGDGCHFWQPDPKCMLVTMHLGGGYHFWQPDPKCMLVTMHLGDGYHFWQPDPKCMLVTMQLGDGYHFWQPDPNCMLVTQLRKSRSGPLFTSRWVLTDRGRTEDSGVKVGLALCSPPGGF